MLQDDSYLPHRQFRNDGNNDEESTTGYLPHRQFRNNTAEGVSLSNALSAA